MDISKTKVITITLTQSCNLSCVYCYEQYKSPRTIRLETAKRIIDREMEDYSAFENIEIDFFGGEPFLAFETLKSLTDYINQKYSHAPITLFTTTNGTLVHGEIQDWLRCHSDSLVCCLSLDGNAIVPDPIPYIDEIIMVGGMVSKLYFLDQVGEFISEHKILSLLILILLIWCGVQIWNCIF